MSSEPPRRIPDPGFSGDDGRADPTLTSALEAAAADAALLPAVLAALHASRVLAPVVALLGERTGRAGRPDREKSSDIAVPLLLDAGGARALPVFTGLAALARWDPAARPVPVPGSRAAEVALAEGAEALVLDVAGPSPLTLPLPEVRALAEGRGRVPAWADPAVSTAVAGVLDAEPAARSARLGPCAGADALLTVVVEPTADPAAVAARLGPAVAELPVVRAGVRGLQVTVAVSPEAPGMLG